MPLKRLQFSYSKFDLNKILYHRIEKRVEERKRKWEEDVENELKQQREATRFKARPATVLEEEIFVSFICNVVTRFSHLQTFLKKPAHTIVITFSPCI